MNLKQELIKAQSNMQSQFDEIVKTEIKKIQAQLNEEVNLLKGKLTNEISRTMGIIFMVQGSKCLHDKDYITAAASYAYAANNSLMGADDLNGQRSLDNLCDNCLKNLNKKSFEDTNLVKKLDDLLVYLNSVNQTRRYTDYISSISLGIEKAKERIV